MAAQEKGVSAEVCEIKHTTLVKDIKRITLMQDELVRPETGALASIEKSVDAKLEATKTSLESKISKVDAKVTTIILLLLTSAIGIVTSILTEIAKGR